MTGFFKLLLFASLFFIIISHSQDTQAQTCESNLFAKHYSYNGVGYGGYLDTIPSGGFIIGDNRNGKTLIKADEGGNFLWAKSYSFIEALTYSEKGSGKVDRNGNYVIDINSSGLALLNPQGDVLVMKQLRAQNLYAVVILGIYVLPDNKKLVFLDDQSFYGGDAYALVCLSPDLSSVVWTKYIWGNPLFLGTPNFSDNMLYFGGRTYSNGVLFAINAATGAVVKQAQYQIQNLETTCFRLYKSEGGYLATAFYNQPFNQFNTAVLRLDDDLNILSATGFDNITNQSTLQLIPEEGGGYYGTCNSGAHRFGVSPTDQVNWSKSSTAGFLYSPFTFMRYKGGLLTGSLGNWFNVGINTNTSSLAIIKTDENGYFPCFGYTFNLPNQPVSASKSNFLLNIKDSSFLTVLNATPIVNTLLYDVPPYCSSVNPCNSLDIQGERDVCGTGTQTYIGRRNEGCALPVNWSITGGSVTKTKLNDSTLQVNFTQAGNFQLIAKLGGGCETIADTINIVVSNNTQNLNIGPADSLLCVGNTIVLNAGSGFTSYLWQDGSTAQSYTVTSPGQYHVAALSVCGILYYDTINITQAPPVNISIGPDRSKCNNDTIQLHAPSGFLNYTWGNNYNINTLVGPSVVVNPQLDTIYFIKAEKTPGCFGYDTVRVQVANSAPISLGADTSICTGQTLTLNAGAGFSSYLWSTGSNSNQLIVNTPGVYFVAATAATGCKSYDTLELISVYPQPVVSLNKNEGLCKGDVRILNAGQHSSYLWQDGSTLATFPAQAIGTYYVLVSDVNGCMNSDTSKITRIDNPPADFLPLFMEICNYGSSLLQATTNFQRYQWSTGSQSKSISISTPGAYWLHVVDINGCRGVDTINVTQKQCLKGLYVPTAFTPNNDGRNDLFRAMLFGNIQTYDFKIYTRYGEIVFASNNTNKGWDGTIAGTKQDSGVYVWTCTYSLVGESIKSEKGTFVLIR